MNISPIAAAPDTATPAMTAAPVPVEVASAFDSILALESLAATPPALDVTCMEDLVVQEDGEGDEETEGEIEDLLAFLSTLLNPLVPAQSQAAPQAGATSGGSEDAAAMPATAGGTAGQGKTAELAPLIARVADQPEVAEVAVELGTAESDVSEGVEPGTTPRGADWVQPAARHAAVVASSRIATPARDPRWAEEFGTRIALMVRGGESSAALQLSPVDLGPVEVSVTVRDSQATIHFGAAQSETRALIEASIPRLREMLEAQGFNLMDASVSQGFSRQAQQGSQVTAHGGIDAEADQPSASQVKSLGLLDLYA